jgi:hypothetical protein
MKKNKIFIVLVFLLLILSISNQIKTEIIQTDEVKDISILINNITYNKIFNKNIVLTEKSSGLEIPGKEGGNTEYEIADINDDGYLDIISVGDHGSPYINSDQHGIMVWFGNGGNYWNVNQTGNFGYGGCGIGDINLDGYKDIAWGVHHNYASDDFGDTLIDAAIGDGSGRNWTSWGDGLGSNGESWGMFSTDLADFDVDGDLDIISLSFGCCNGVHIYENHGNGTWSPRWSNTGGNVFMETLETCDFNTDGYPDFICSHEDFTSFYGNGSFGFTNSDNGLPVGSINGIDVGDMNKDGSDDLVTALDGFGIKCYVYDIENSSWKSESTGLPNNGDYYLTQFGDLNNDSNLDIVAYTDPTGKIYLGDGNGSWIEDTSWNMASPGDPSAMRVNGDVDFDGREDIIIQASEGSWPNDVNMLKLFSPWQEPSQLNVQIKKPNGGEVFRISSIRNIRWLTSVPSTQDQATIDIQLSLNGESGAWNTIVSNIPNNGLYQWKVNGSGSNNCRIKIIANTSLESASTLSSSDFTIIGNNQSDLIINLSSNWNFISLPFNNSLNKTEFLIYYMNNYYNWTEAIDPMNGPIVDPSIYGWDRIIDIYYPSDYLNPGFGYWIYAYASCNLFIQNYSVNYDNFITYLVTGWNAMGVTKDQNVDLIELIVNYDGVDYNWLESINPSNGPILDPNIYGWDTTYGMYVPVVDNLKSGNSYWIYAYEDCILFT